MTSTSHQAGTSLEHVIGPRGRFLLRQTSGEVTIRGTEGDRVRVRALDGRSISERFNVEAGEGVLEIRQIEKLGIGLGIFGPKESAELEVEVPHGASVRIDTQSGDITASDLSGAKVFRTASGEVSLLRLAGAVDVETVSGEIELDGQAPVDLLAKSVSGDVAIRVPSIRRLDLGTTSGDLKLDAALTGDGPFTIRSISGDVLVIGRNGFRVEAESITGDLSSDLPSKRESMSGRKVLIVGRPGPTLTFRSVSGDFHVAQPRDAAPEPVAPPAPPAAPSAPAAPEAPGAPDAPTPPTPPSPAGSDGGEAGHMAILRALERGDIDVAEATRRLGELDEVTR